MAKVTHNVDIVSSSVPTMPHTFYTPERAIEQRWREAMSYLVFKWPLFAQLIYSGMPIRYTEDIPLAATDSHHIFLNPDRLEDHNINDVFQRAFVLAHEVGHRIFDDLAMMNVWNATKRVLLSNGSWLPYSHELMNVAQDFRINGMLVDAKIGKMPAIGHYDKLISEKGFESSVEIYEKLWHSGRVQFYRALGSGQHGGFDLHIPPTVEQTAADKGKREQEIVAAHQLGSRVRGSVPGAIERLVEAIVKPKVPWEQHLKASMKRKAGEPKLDWSKTNRRLISRTPELYFAGQGHKGAGLIVLGADNSGSIGKDTINVFASEMAGICAELNPMELIVLWCDAAITREYTLEEPADLTGLFADWKVKGVGGGGGTDFRPVFEWIEQHGVMPDMLVYFTDMMGRFPDHEPRYPTIWAATTNIRAPWGEWVHVEIPREGRR